MSERLFHLAEAPFQAARRIAALAPGHRAGRLHGHSFSARALAELPPGWGGFDGAETEALDVLLKRVIDPLDYADLNAHLPLPTDASLAVWLRTRLGNALQAPAAIAQVGIQSTADQGVELVDGEAPGDDQRVYWWRRFELEAAHRLVNVPADHPCGRMHGHGFAVRLLVALDRSSDQGPIDDAASGQIGESGALGDAQLDALWAPLHERLDHRCLNDVPGLENPTSERLAHWLWERLKPQLPALAQVSVYETATAGCHYDGQTYRIWKEMRFESALRLRNAPDGDARRRLHGHSYRLRLHLTAPLDEVLGWTVDYGDVKRLFKPVYDELDHHELNELEQLSDPSAANLALWIREQVVGSLPQVDRLELTERKGRGVLLSWDAVAPSNGKPRLPL
ncbi:6-pyruvoyl tetrahydropterin synthase [Halochromatium glycolicum]|jgi:6-pyruvoyltetrahydropterin/6-carboxytetrahydropterin synthase|uniref:6-carboxy-5,6,7,8-tetrahydropterin synthase n=1 Tax=Halochromatium glycolicum TaxID=85075 RepID=A0AAJ0U1T1_9GAMM|nr:6-carboxytetrahydropterin synthase [Halochromatium glycolicum]MBK1703696.1 6-pyruvoyl tetrahydropterin synthase [Halochromatium glycolicum]